MDGLSNKQIAREAAAKVESSLPPGTELRHISTGDVCLIGARHRDGFWMMHLGVNPRRGVVEAREILRQYVTGDGECL